MVWDAERQTLGATSTGTTGDPLSGTAVRVLIKGNNLPDGNISADGDGCKILFKASNNATTGLTIEKAYIGEVANSNAFLDLSEMIVENNIQIKFKTKDNVRIIKNDEVWSDIIDIAIDDDKSYAISYLVIDMAKERMGNPYYWVGSSAIFNSIVIPSEAAPTEATLTVANWAESYTNISYRAEILAVSKVKTTFNEEGIYHSRIIDTGLAAPEYNYVAWNTPNANKISLESSYNSSIEFDPDSPLNQYAKDLESNIILKYRKLCLYAFLLISK